MPKGIFVVRSGPASAEQEKEYNDWYDNAHVPELLAIDGFVTARRYRLLGDDGESTHPYLAVYELEAEDLTAPLQAMRQRAAATPPTGLRLDPPPITELYELKE